MNYTERKSEVKCEEAKNTTSWLNLSEEEIHKITDTSVCMYSGGATHTGGPN